MSSEMVKMQSDKEKFIENGQMYTFDRYSADMMRKFWRCQQNDFCKARIHTDLQTNQVKNK